MDDVLRQYTLAGCFDHKISSFDVHRSATLLRDACKLRAEQAFVIVIEQTSRANA